MARDDVITKADLRKWLVPEVKKFLREEKEVQFFRERDHVGHMIHTHASSERYPAEIIYETIHDWAEEFIDWYGEIIAVGIAGGHPSQDQDFELSVGSAGVILEVRRF
jgi:hypothetical protein